MKHTFGDAQTVPTLNVSNSSLDLSREKQKWPHLADLQLPNTTHGTVNVLLGADVFELIVPRRVVEERPVP